MTPRYDVRVAPPAARAIRDELPESVAAAVIEFILGALAENPRRVGHPLRAELLGLWSARRGTYRVIYSIDEDVRVVTVLRVGHRGQIYR